MGERQSTEAIANEYADADPIFVRKTAVSFALASSLFVSALFVLGFQGRCPSIKDAHRLTMLRPVRPCLRSTPTTVPFAAMATAVGEVSFGRRGHRRAKSCRRLRIVAPGC